MSSGQNFQSSTLPVPHSSIIKDVAAIDKVNEASNKHSYDTGILTPTSQSAALSNKEPPSSIEKADIRTSRRSNIFYETDASEPKYVPRLVPPSPPTSPVPMVAIQYESQTNPINPLLTSANKTLATSSWVLGLKEHCDRQTIDRIDQLKQENRWSLRQYKRSIEPPQLKCHRNYLCEEVLWMRRDFTQEKRWKIAAAKLCADAVIEWWEAEDKSTVTVSGHKVSNVMNDNISSRIDTVMTDDRAEAADMVELLDANYEAKALITGQMHGTPQSLDSLDEQTRMVQEVVRDTFNERHPLHCDKLFDLDPIDINFSFSSALSSACQLFSQLPLAEPIAPPLGDEYIELPALTSISRFLTSPTVIKERPRKKIRLEDTDKETQHFAYRPGICSFGPAKDVSPGRKRPLLISPPRPPPQSYIEMRQLTTWTQDDDENLILYAKEFTYNFDIIADYLSPRTRFNPVTERRSAWECFERWMTIDPAASGATLLGPHTKIVMQRLDRRKKFAPTRVESKRRSKVLSMFETMRKVCKKREMVQKPTPPPLKKAVSSTESTRPPVPSPLELIKLISDRDNKQQIFERNAQAMAISSQPQPSLNGRNGSSGNMPIGNQIQTDAIAAAVATAQRQPGQGRVSGNVRNQTSPNSARAIASNTRLTTEQISALLTMQRNQAAQQQTPSNQNIANNPAILAILQQAQAGSPASHNASTGKAGLTPESNGANAGRITDPENIGPTIAAITAHIAREHPDLDQQQVAKIAQAQFAKYVSGMRQQHVAMAANGSVNGPNGSNSNHGSIPQTPRSLSNQTKKVQQQAMAAASSARLSPNLPNGKANGESRKKN